MAFRPDGVVLSNGPGNPQDVTPVIELVQRSCAANCRSSASAWAISSFRWLTAPRP